MADSICADHECERTVRAVGLCGMHYQRLRKIEPSVRELKPCGTPAAYVRGCRCDECVEAFRARSRKPGGKPFRAAKDGPHGLARYRRGKCRCDICRTANNESMAEWRKQNRDVVHKWNKHSYAKRKGMGVGNSDTRYWVALIVGDPCPYCGDSLSRTIDHILPAASGGLHRWENLTAACRSCNASKNKHSLLSFLLRAAKDADDLQLITAKGRDA